MLTKFYILHKISNILPDFNYILKCSDLLIKHKQNEKQKNIIDIMGNQGESGLSLLCLVKFKYTADIV